MKILGGYAFTETEVRAIAAGKKTRFTAKAWEVDSAGQRIATRWQRALPGDLVWMQEPFVYWKHPKGGADSWGFRADFKDRAGFPPSPSFKHRCHVGTALELPRDKSRYTLEITVKTDQVLGDVSDDELDAEGIMHTLDGSRSGYAMFEEAMLWEPSRHAAFRRYLASSRGRTAYHHSTPIVGLSFKLHRQAVNDFVKGRT